jgi:hypothetical protein
VPRFNTYILLVYRPEAVIDPDSVFSGIEILGLFGTEADVNTEIDKYHGDHPEWKFCYESIDIAKRKPKLPLFDSGNPDLSREVDEMFGSGRDR